MSDSWKQIGIREKMQIVNGTFLIISAIGLYFLAFALTLSIGFDVISAGATMLATGLAFFGVTSYIKNQLVDFETKIEKRLDRAQKEGTDEGEE